MFQEGDVVPTFFDVIKDIGDHRYTLYRKIVPRALNVHGGPKVARTQ
jgi:hypothetical protein